MEANIGLFNESFPPVMDGVAVCVQNYAYWMQKKVGGISVVAPGKLGANYRQYPYEVLEYMAVPVPFRHPYVTGIAQIDPLLRAKLARRRFKIVHAHSPFSAGLMAAQVARSQNIPLVATFHSKFRDDFLKVVPSDMLVDQALKVVMEFFDRADEVWVPQASVREVIREYGYKGNVEVVRNGSDLVADYPESYFSDSRKVLGVGPDEFVFLFVGQHIWQKNTRFIIDGLERIKDLPYRMFFVGTGYAAQEMKELVREKGLEGKVTFAGMVSDREELTRYYAASDLFLFPSLYDTDGLVVKEAAALGSPSVMLYEASASGVITHGVNGFLSHNNLDDFESLLRSLVARRDLVRRAGEEASRTLVRSWEDVVDEVLDRYNALIARKSLIRPLK